MNVLILGGNSRRHYDWIRELGGYLERHGHTVRLHDYQHWTTGEPVADVEHELTLLSRTVAGLDEYVVIAKSIGTVIAALGVARGVLKPARCMLLGVPFDGIAGSTPDFVPSLASLPATTVIQNEHDPYGAASEVMVRIETAGMKEVRCITIPGNATHDYVDFGQIETLL